MRGCSVPLKHAPSFKMGPAAETQIDLPTILTSVRNLSTVRIDSGKGMLCAFSDESVIARLLARWLTGTAICATREGWGVCRRVSALGAA